MPQDALRDPEKWNSNWEALLQRDLACPSGPPHLFQLKMMEITVSLAQYPELVDGTCEVQRDITAEALFYFSQANLETRWMDAGADMRGKHILDAMAALCSKARNLNEARSYCPELSLKHVRADGKVFLGLVKSVMLEDASFIPSKPKVVSHPGWDAWAAEQEKLNDSELKKVSFAEILILRTKLIYPSTGYHPPEFLVQKESKSQKAKTPTLPPRASGTLRTCQKADWKLRHKAVCGKALDFETVSQPVENPASASTADTRIGPPVNGYKRSLALIAQVTGLNSNPMVDYYLYDAGNQPLNIDLGAGQYPQRAFRARRELAMTTGHSGAVLLMAHYLCIWSIAMGGPSKLKGITPNMIVAQFAREFGLEAKLHERVLAAQQLQDRDPLHRPPLLAHMPPDLWGVLNKDMNLDKVVLTLDYSEKYSSIPTIVKTVKLFDPTQTNTLCNKQTVLPVEGYLSFFVDPALKTVGLEEEFLGVEPIPSLGMSKSGCKLQEVHIRGTSHHNILYRQAFPAIPVFQLLGAFGGPTD
ncbi:Condensin complex subunit 2 [Mycena sanguinolenta]|uniref:Condensin complex subunit 2 n=1 Tax=Mycena sanguinolenta TaxID=230812 RepID=A0A8H6ZI30_9AGAR|nr:Condensin complex subunit 2 [Mycena sanguinolenta]